MFGEFARGGFASVHLGRSLGAGGFAKTVAIKRLHSQYAKDPGVRTMLLDEARVVARINHPNVVPTLDLVEDDGELFIVMDYVEGVTLAHVFRKVFRPGERIPLNVVLRIMSGVLHGLHAAHEAKGDGGEPLSVIHRDVAPDNILIGVDGFTRLLDFGVARALGRNHSTRDGQLKGKLAYMTPEQVGGEALSRQTDIFSASNVLWQAMVGRRLFEGSEFPELAHKVLNQTIQAPSELVGDLPRKLDAIVLRGLEQKPEDRWSSAEKMAEALEAVGKLAPHRQAGEWIRTAAASACRKGPDRAPHRRRGRVPCRGRLGRARRASRRCWQG